MSWEVINHDLVSAGWNPGQIDEARQALVPRSSEPKPLKAPSASSRFQYTSPFSALLAVVLVVSLLILTQNAVQDILNKFAPLNNNFYGSQQYQDYQKEYQKESQDLRMLNNSRPSDPNSYQQWQDQYNSQKQKLSSLQDQYLQDYNDQPHSSPSFRMILQTIIVLPFWILTFVIFLSLKGDRRRYNAIIVSYFITSGWLLILLLFNIVSYIWNTSTTLGVYVALGMLVAVLTGAIWGVQKYRHSLDNV